MEPITSKKEQVIIKCPFCRSEKFTVDWSVRDARSDPVGLKERYICDDCGKRYAQEWLADGWRMTRSPSGVLKTGRNYLEKCVECGCDDLNVRHGDNCFDRFEEDYRCEECGAEHVQVWKAAGWSEIDGPAKFGVEVLSHDRPTIKSDDDAEKYRIDMPLEEAPAEEAEK